MKQLTLRQYSSCLVSSRVTRAVHTCILSMESLFGPDRSGYHRMTIAVASVAYLAVRRFARRAVCSVAACAFVVSAVVDAVADAAAHPGGSAAAEWTEDELLALSPMQLAEISVVSASLTPQRLADSPASVSVITAKQIARMGARTLYDVLRHVPGMRVDVTNRGRPVISVRGVRRDSSNQLLFLLDGHRRHRDHLSHGSRAGRLRRQPGQPALRPRLRAGSGAQRRSQSGRSRRTAHTGLRGHRRALRLCRPGLRAAGPAGTRRSRSVRIAGTVYPAGSR